MRVAALLSGGKDSVAAVEVAQGWGWEVACAVLLRPAADDAWMFHTPNLDAAKGVAACLGLPVVEWKARTGEAEEVADLADALREAVRRHRVEGIVSGALASEYQRTRIDAVGHQLGIKTFAPLWHKEPVGYLEGLLAGGYEIAFSRVAAGGVPPEWAGQGLDAAKVEALLKSRFRPHPAGEGGEYETLVLDAPHYRSRLKVQRSHVVREGGRATWVVDAWVLEPKPQPPEPPRPKPKRGPAPLRP